MGCFSFKCKECGESILSNDDVEEMVILYLLKDGKVVQKMTGRYDSYGRVYTPCMKDSIKWDMDWDDVCDLMFDEDVKNGIFG